MDRFTYQHYEVIRRPDGTPWELGRGAMGVTYKAQDTNLHAPVALKVIASDLLPDARARTRFLREARAAAQLRHTNIAAVYHLGQETDACFYTMEFIEGETAEALVRRQGPLPTTTALEITLQVARALQAAHERGLLHRDLKPSNLMVLREGGDLLVKVIDFGLVKPLQTAEDGDDPGVAGSSASLSRGLFLGTPLFASPEQCVPDGELDARADLYSLGATLWYLLTGEPPFRGATRTVMAQHLTKPPPFEALSAKPPAVVELLRALLQKEPADRPRDAAAVRTLVGETLRDPAGAGPFLPPAPAAPAVPGLGEITLAALLRSRGRLAPAEVGTVLFPLAAILDAAHAEGRRCDLAPGEVRLRLLRAADAPEPPSVSLSVDRPLTEWPPFGLETTPTGSDGGMPATMSASATNPAAALGDLVSAMLHGPANSPAGLGRPPSPALSVEGNAALANAADYPSAAALAITLAAALFKRSGTVAQAIDPVRPPPVPGGDADSGATLLENPSPGLRPPPLAEAVAPSGRPAPGWVVALRRLFDR